MTASVIAQVVMVLTLLLMITGKTPIYMTAIVGATLSALIAGFPIMGSAEMTIAKMVNTGLNPVIADMTGILLFIGIMQATGFLDVIIRDIVRVGNKLGGGTGVCSAGGIAAGVIGALTGFTQPVITAVITGPAAVRLGVDPNKCAGIQGSRRSYRQLGRFHAPDAGRPGRDGRHQLRSVQCSRLDRLLDDLPGFRHPLQRRHASPRRGHHQGRTSANHG